MSRSPSKAAVRFIGMRDGWGCHYCGLTQPRELWTVDHVIPLSLGGPRRSRWNLVMACSRCNSRKGSRVGCCDCLVCATAHRRLGVSAPLVAPERWRAISRPRSAAALPAC